MKFHEPISVGLFVLVVLTMSFMLGKHQGYQRGFEKADTEAFAEGHVAGWQDAQLHLQQGLFIDRK